MESMLGAFARGTLQAVRGRVSVRTLSGATVELNGWSRSMEGLSERPLVVTSAVDAKGDATLPDHRYWVAQAPHVFGLSTDRLATTEDNAAKRADQLEQHMWRMAQEIRAAGFLPAADETFSLGSIKEFAELTTRQREIVTRLLAGERVGEIARDMYLSPSTIRNHLTAVFRKFGVHSQVELISLLKNPRAHLGR
jgi:DNA-binding CsgD family transcriptional regulator